jgi:hypothetical protein
MFVRVCVLSGQSRRLIFPLVSYGEQPQQSKIYSTVRINWGTTSVAFQTSSTYIGVYVTVSLEPGPCTVQFPVILHMLKVRGRNRLMFKYPYLAEFSQLYMFQCEFRYR